ncbi:hypothetical protein VNO80_07574 [Phaseolus coccineus]|uniref:Uncharacterized protein n=1 Tax=Phaseolus coccineus TaxID=3886 RepID=A0AAN9RPV2_PHACN
MESWNLTLQTIEPEMNRTTEPKWNQRLQNKHSDMKFHRYTYTEGNKVKGEEENQKGKFFSTFWPFLKGDQQAK